MTNNQIKELESRVDEVLYYIWDPLGVSNEPSARGEYSSYTAKVLEFTLLEDVNKIVDLLFKIQFNLMEIGTTSANNKEVAERLVEYKIAIENGLR